MEKEIMNYDDAICCVSQLFDGVCTKTQMTTTCEFITMMLYHVKECDLEKVIDFISRSEQRVKRMIK